MKLEEAIKILNDLKENVALFSTGWYPILKESEKKALETVLNYIKEESIPRAVVEEKIEELKEKSGGNVFHIQQTINSNIRLLQEILTKGE